MRRLQETLLVGSMIVAVTAACWQQVPEVRDPSRAPDAQPREPGAEDLELDAVPAASPGALSERASAERSRLWTDMVGLLNCDHDNTCPEDDSDPRASAVLRATQLASLARQYTELHVREDYFDEKSRAAVVALLAFPDGHVQERAIALMSLQAPQPELGQALLKTVGKSFDAKIVRQTLGELKRYPELADDIDQQLERVLLTGSFLAAEAVAAEIVPFLRPANSERFELVLAQMPPGSARARSLRASLREYQRRLSGG